MENKMFIKVTDGSFRKAKMFDASKNVQNMIKDRTRSYFQSAYFYNEDAYEQFKKTNSTAGVTEVYTNQLWWDLDAKDLDTAKQSTLNVKKRLLKMGVREEQIQVRFSGKKGFHIFIKLNKLLNPEQVRNICEQIAGDLPGFDSKVYNATRVLRIPLTKHNDTGMFCRPIQNLENKSITEVLKEASDITDVDTETVILKDEIDIKLFGDLPTPKVPEIKVSKIAFDLKDLNFDEKPNFLDNARWALQNGYFHGSSSKDVGDRSWVLLCLAATYKNLGFQLEQTRALLTGVIELQANRTGEEKFDEHELDHNILSQIYGPHWKGGQFSRHDPKSPLYQYIKEYNIPLDEGRQSEQKPIKFSDVSEGFIDFALNAEKSTVTIGLPEIDEEMPIMAGMNLGILGAPSSGKSTLMLQIAEHTSKNNIPIVLASLDMARNRMFLKLLIKESGLKQKQVIELFKTPESELAQNLLKRINEKYKNVWFYDKSFATVEDIRKYVETIEEDTGQKIKLVMFDYFERLNSDMSDENMSSKKIAGQIQDLVNDLGLAAITFVQPNKMAFGDSGISSPLTDFNNIKGSSYISQSFRAILSLWRPFNSADFSEHDHFIQMAILKNDLGELKQFDFGWDGAKGRIYNLETIEKTQLKELLKMKNEMRDEKKQNKLGF